MHGLPHCFWDFGHTSCWFRFAGRRKAESEHGYLIADVDMVAVLSTGKMVLRIVFS